MIHDGNRPLVSQDVISDCIAKTSKHGCAIAAIPATEVILVSEDNVSSDRHIDRSILRRTQTPHGFNFGTLFKLYTDALEKKVASVAACDLMIEMGKTVFLSRGSEKNIKITTVEDIDIFKALLATTKDSYIKE